jgi:glutamyl endopeptidase
MRIPSRPLSLESYLPPWMTSSRAKGLDGANSTLLELAASLGVLPASKAPAPGRVAAASLDAGTDDGGAGGGGAPQSAGAKAKALLSMLTDFLSMLQPGGSKGAAAAAPAAAASDSATAAPGDDTPVANASTAAALAAVADSGLLGAPGAPSTEARRRRLRATARRRALLGVGRSLQELVGGDDRTDCDRGFPYTAIGQIQIVDSTGLYICTGTLIAPDKVLTAGHCVWNIKRGAFYYNLNYAPGRYRDGGNVVNPWGVVPWKSVTVFDSFKQNPSTWDVAVVTLSKPLGSLTGYMGIAAGCAQNLPLTTAGYPQDKSTGTCMASTCLQPNLDCSSPTNPHTCDTIMGMSGSPLWDGKNRVRLVHVAGIEGRAENRATTLTQFLVNTISKW